MILRTKIKIFIGKCVFLYDFSFIRQIYPHFSYLCKDIYKEQFVMDFSRFMPTLPFSDPVLIFFIVLTIILFAPLLLNRLRIPHIIGMILAGMIFGPHGLNFLAHDSSFTIFGNVGLLYLMFLVGLEMNIHDFRKIKSRGIAFGTYTFLLPMILGTLSSYYLLRLDLPTSILLASMYASHTLVAYPIVLRYGVGKQPAVTITIAGTVITVLGALCPRQD